MRFHRVRPSLMTEPKKATANPISADVVWCGCGDGIDPDDLKCSTCRSADEPDEERQAYFDGAALAALRALPGVHDVTVYWPNTDQPEGTAVQASLVGVPSCIVRCAATIAEAADACRVALASTAAEVATQPPIDNGPRLPMDEAPR